MGFIGINDEATMKGIRDCCTDTHVFIKDLRLGSNNKERQKVRRRIPKGFLGRKKRGIAKKNFGDVRKCFNVMSMEMHTGAKTNFLSINYLEFDV